MHVRDGIWPKLFLAKERGHWFVVPTIGGKNPEFDLAKRDRRRNGPEKCRRSGNIGQKLKQVADDAWHTMCDLKKPWLQILG